MPYHAVLLVVIYYKQSSKFAIPRQSKERQQHDSWLIRRISKPSFKIVCKVVPLQT